MTLIEWFLRPNESHWFVPSWFNNMGYKMFLDSITLLVWLKSYAIENQCGVFVLANNNIIVRYGNTDN